MDRQHRHDLKHDKFVDEIGALSARARDNQRILIMVAGGILAIAAIVWGIYFYRSSRERKAQESLATAIDTISAPVEATPQPGRTGLSFKTEAERTNAAERQFKDVQSKYSGTDASDVAGLFLARMAVAKGDTASARKMLEEFIADHKGNLVLAGGARYSLYQLRIENGEAAQVAVELNAEMNKAEPALPGDALLMLLAHAYDAQGNAAKSKEAYRRITTEFPDSAYAVEAARRAG